MNSLKCCNSLEKRGLGSLYRMLVNLLLMFMGGSGLVARHPGLFEHSSAKAKLTSKGPDVIMLTCSAVVTEGTLH